MASNFLQRFKGKTTTLSKNAVNEILGSKNVAQIQPINKISKQTKKAKSCMGQNTNNNFSEDLKNTTNNQLKQHIPIKINKSENPFLVANPFYLDEQEKQRQQQKRKEKLQLESQLRKEQYLQNCAHDKNDSKQVNKNFGYSRSLQKKNLGNKQWVRFGGLGANIGGDEWMEKKKKQQKIQEFSGQVKSINAERIKPIKPDIPKYKCQKEVNARQKALQYSKNVPKPVIRKLERLEDEEQNSNYQQKRLPQEQGLSELQIYQMKHEQLKKMINHNS